MFQAHRSRVYVKNADRVIVFSLLYLHQDDFVQAFRVNHTVKAEV